MSTGGNTADGAVFRNTELRGEGVGLDYRPSPRQLRRSSPKRMMCGSVSEDRGDRSVRISMRDRLDVTA
jgi:hypothetical protein